MKLIQRIKENKDIIILIGLVLIPVILISFFVSHIIISKENRDLKKQIEFYETDCIREAEIVAIETEGSVVYVNDYELGIIDVDIYWEGIHTTIEIGDTAVYTMDYERTDADLLNIVKRGA